MVDGPGPAPSRAPARETRLLVLTLVIPVVTLLLLAQFRFPDSAPRPSAPPPTALDELATRAAFDAQAGAVRDVARRLEESLVRLRWVPPGGRGFETPAARALAGLRIRDDHALVGVPGGLELTQTAIEVLDEGRWLPAPPVGTDHARRVALVRVPASRAPVLAIAAENRLPGFLAATRAGPAGAGLRPVWVGALARVERSAWTGSVWALPEDPDRPGAGTLLFTSDGSFVGLVTDGVAGTVLVPAALALEHARELASGRSFTGGDGGFTVLDLASPALRAAAGRSDGALVGWVDPAGPASTALQTGDVVIRMDGEPVLEAGDVRRALARREPGTRTSMTFTRDGQEQATTIVLRPPPHAPPPADGGAAADQGAGPGLGLTLRRAGNAVSVVGVDPRGAAAGVLVPGDRITWLRGLPQLTPEGVARAYDALPAGGALLLRIAPAPSAGPARAPDVPEQTIAVLKP